jgi:peptidoglycan hydrolase CwlO-like protein
LEEDIDSLVGSVLTLENKISAMQKIIDEQLGLIENYALIQKNNQEAIHQLSRSVENYRIVKDHLNLSSGLNIDFDLRIAAENIIKEQYVHMQKQENKIDEQEKKIDELEKKIDEQEKKLNRITGSKMWPYVTHIRKLIRKLRRIN